jgi:hypothetical protein
MEKDKLFRETKESFLQERLYMTFLKDKESVT